MKIINTQLTVGMERHGPKLMWYLNPTPLCKTETLIARPAYSMSTTLNCFAASLMASRWLRRTTQHDVVTG